MYLCVERSHGHWELVEDVEIGFVFLADDFAELFLHRGGQISLECLLFRDVDSGFFEKVDTVEVFQAEGFAIFDLEVAGFWEVLLDYCYLVLVAGQKFSDDEHDERFSKAENFVVVIVEDHFKVEAGELVKLAGVMVTMRWKTYLGQMSMCIAVFCSENWTNFVNSFTVTGDEHLLVELRTL